MREMKDSGVAWIGKIPTKWTIAKAKNCVEIQNGSDPKTEGSIPVYGSGSMSFKTCGEYKEGPSVLIGRKGATLHIPHYISSKFWNVDTAFNVYSKSIFDLKYYFYCAHVFDYKLYMSQTTLPSMTQTAYENMFLPLPTKEEQCAIANQLDQVCAEIDAVLEKTRASIEEYKKLKQAVITQAVTKGIRGDRPMKDSGIEWIGDIPAEWDVLNLVAHTSMLTPMRDRPENLDGPIPWVRIEDFEGKYIESSKAGLGVSMKTVKEMNLKVYPVGTILCTSSCIMGKCAIVSRELVSNQRFIGIIPDRTTDKTYLYYLMTSNAERMNFLSTGALQANLSRSAFEHLKVQFPPYSEQREIAAYLDDKCEKIDELILKKQQYLTEIENYKKSLIYEYVTGKKEVKTSVLAD